MPPPGTKAAADRDAASARFRHLATSVFALDSQLATLPGTTSVLAASDGVQASWTPPSDSGRLVRRSL